MSFCSDAFQMFGQLWNKQSLSALFNVLFPLNHLCLHSAPEEFLQCLELVLHDSHYLMSIIPNLIYFLYTRAGMITTRHYYSLEIQVWRRRRRRRVKLGHCASLLAPSSTTYWVSCNEEVADARAQYNLIQRLTQPVVPLYCHMCAAICC